MPTTPTPKKHRLLEIAEKLGELHQSKKGAEITLANNREDYTARLTAIIPDGGWPGKNEEARKAAAAQAEQADAALTAMRSARRELESDIADFEADIEQLSIERRALEWIIREQLVIAISGRADVAVAPTNSAYADEFDGAGDGAALNAVAAQANGFDAYADSEIPF